MEEERKKKEKKQLLLVIAIFAIIFVVVVGGSYAYFSARATNSGSTITGRTLDINGTTLTIRADRVDLEPDPVPLSDDLVPANYGALPTEVTTTEVNRALSKQCAGGGYTGCHVWKVTATSSIDIPSANIKLNLSLSGVVDKDEWSYVVYIGTDTNSETILNKGLINTTFPNSNRTLDIHNGASLQANTPAIYYVMIYLNNTNSVQNDGVTDNTTDERGTYNGTVILEAMGGEVYVNFYEEEVQPTDVSFFSYEIVPIESATYTVSDQSACESYLQSKFSMPSEVSTTFCSGGSVDGQTLGDFIVYEDIPSSDYATAGLSNINIIENNEVKIIRYHGTATYTVTDQSACESYIVNLGDSSENAAILCSGSSVNGVTLGDVIAQGFIPSNDYASAGLSNVVITPAPTEVIIPSTIEGYPVTTIEHNAFSDKSLTSVVIPDSVTTIGEEAFYDNQLTSITIGNENVNIGNCAFGENPPLDEPFLSNYACESITTEPFNPGGQQEG